MKFYVLAQPTFNAGEFLRFLADVGESWNRTPGTKSPQELVEVAGRLCYMSFGSRQSPKDNGTYVKNLISMGHESVLEHISWTFLVTGISRAFSHQLVRHRVGVAFSQLSQQYHDETAATAVEPVELAAFPQLREQWKHSLDAAKLVYCKLLEELDKEKNLLPLQRREQLRAIRSIARSVLPNSTETKIVFTANARAIRHILEVRGNIPGDSEMRLFSVNLFQQVVRDAPELFGDFYERALDDGLPILEKQRFDEQASTS